MQPPILAWQPRYGAGGATPSRQRPGAFGRVATKLESGVNNVRGNGNRMRTNGPRRVKHRAMFCACGGDTDAVVCRVLAEEGYEVVACPDHEALLERAINDPPDVIIYSLTPRGPIDRGVLQLVRRNFPKTPLVVVASEGSLETQRVLQEFRPTYYAVAPFDKGELRDAVRAAMAQRERLTLGDRGAA